MKILKYKDLFIKLQRDYFPTVLIRQKLQTARRRVKVGDVVLVQDCNAFRDIWKLAQIIQADPRRDGIVRDVKLRHKLVKAGRNMLEKNI